jgi:hypothetical protein
MAALDDQTVELCVQRGQIAELAVDLSEVLTRDQIHCRAGYVLLIRKAEQSLNLIEREAECPRPPNEAEPRQMLRRTSAFMPLTLASNAIFWPTCKP